MAPSLNDILSTLGYTLSLPERLLRTIAVTLGGTTKILTDTLIPEPLRKTNTYTAIVGNAQRFLVEKIAEVQGAYADQSGGALPDDYVPRAVAGNIINTVGMLSVHMSPLWVFALASDVAQGSKVYLNRLVAELKQSKVIPEDANIKEVDELLDSLGAAGKDTAGMFDLPPVDVGQLRVLRDRLATGYKSVFKEATDLLPRMDQIWKNMESLAQRDRVSIDSIVGLMTVDLSRAAGKTLDAAYAVGSVTTDLLSETILRSYGETILQIQNKGAVACLDEATRPYLNAIAQHLSAQKETWTEKALNMCLSPFRSGRDSASDVAGQKSQATPDP